RDEVVGLPRIVAGIAGDRDGRVRPRELVQQRIGQDRESRRLRIGGLDGHANAVLAQSDELAVRVDDALGGTGHNRELETRSAARPHGVLGDRLGEVRREPSRPLERGARLARRRYDAGPDGRRWLRSALLPIAARTDEESDRTDEIAKGTNLVEDVLRPHDRELALER